jgi:uncharacterized protein (DUF885 family)
VRAERLAAGVWQSLSEFLQPPTLLPPLPQSWAQTKQHTRAALTAQQEQLRQRKSRGERQRDRLLEAYQAELRTLNELPLRRGKLQEAIHRLEQDLEQFARSRSSALHWQQILEPADRFRPLLGENLEGCPSPIAKQSYHV